MRLSVIIIAFNEASNIAACLESVRFADECIVLDSGSVDGTQAIVLSCGARLESSRDWPGFGLQKNRALDMASGDWVLSLDADERVTPALQVEIEAAMTQQAIKVFSVPRLSSFCGQVIRHCGWYPDRVMRLFERGSARFSDDLVHERLLTSQAVHGLSVPLLHYTYRTPADYWKKLQHYSHDWAVQRHAKGQTASVWRAVASGLFAFVRAYIFRLGFLDGAMGMAVCVMQAQSAYGKYFELYCMGRADLSASVEDVK